MFNRALVGFFILSVVNSTGCEFRNESKPSVLVVAVEGLSFSSFSCEGDSEEQAGFQVFCDESVRFSHAYTPSPMSQSAVASLLTGLHPMDHGVRNNGHDFLQGRFLSVAEVALAQKYRTLFVSGGPPLWRKSGLSQGFEVFDDSMDIGPGNYYRPAAEVFKLFTNWLELEREPAPFFAFTFLSDLQFPLVATKDNDGTVREKSGEAQLQEIGESLESLVRYLKKKRLWNGTHIVLAGLNSLQRPESDPYPSSLNLKSSGVQVALFIKPARKEKDNIIQWAVDQNVSLVDVGATMFRWFSAASPQASVEFLSAKNLTSVLIQPDPSWNTDRLVVTESAWPGWMEDVSPRVAIRQGQFLYINDSQPLIFNTLTDRMETMPLRPDDPLWNSLNSNITKFIGQAQLGRWPGMGSPALEQIDVAKEIWLEREFNRRPRGDERWSRWYLGRALQTKNWAEVLRLSKRAQNSIGVYVATRNLGQFAPLPKDPCVRLLIGRRALAETYRTDCDDEAILNLSLWIAGRTEAERSSGFEKLSRVMAARALNQEIGRMNYLNDLRWDVGQEWPTGPSPIDFLFALKTLEPHAKKLLGILDSKHFTF